MRSGGWAAKIFPANCLLLVHDESIGNRVGKKMVFSYPKGHIRSRFGPRWPHRLAKWIFLCYEHADECSVFAATLSPDLAWRERLVAVRLFLLELEGRP